MASYNPSVNYRVCKLCLYYVNSTCCEKRQRVHEADTCVLWKPSLVIFPQNTRSCYNCAYRKSTICMNSKSKFKNLMEDFPISRIENLKDFICDLWMPNFTSKKYLGVIQSVHNIPGYLDNNYVNFSLRSKNNRPTE